MSRLSHIDGENRARMVDVGDKPVTARRAAARGTLRCAAETLRLVEEGKAPKGAVISTAELAGVMAAKRTAELIPLCHPLQLSDVQVTVTSDPALPGFTVESEVRLHGKTGAEMEALTAVSVACLTLYDMLKAVDGAMRIGDIEVTAKLGGKTAPPAAS